MTIVAGENPEDDCVISNYWGIQSNAHITGDANLDVDISASSGNGGNGSEKLSARVVGRLFFRCFASHRKGYSPLRAGVNTIKTHHAARSVHAMVSRVDTLALALATTQTAVDALRRIYLKLKE